VRDHVDERVADADHVEARITTEHVVTSDRHGGARYRADPRRAPRARPANRLHGIGHGRFADRPVTIR
jgi:hypothetical protein